jgi:16S rRNA (adenine1518-N6/adenine1519-N6)-dimethyltransferase
MSVRAKKHLGQHFLKDESVCQRMVQAIDEKSNRFDQVLEIGPGMGALTKFLLQSEHFKTAVVEIDRESVAYLQEHYPVLKDAMYDADFLKADIHHWMGEQSFALVGNFPYNISSQILFKALEYHNQIPLIVGMFQKEVAERIAEKPGSKKYGILSVLLQAYYDIDYLFTIPPTAFIPPPKVDSGVIQLVRNDVEKLPCDETSFVRVVKMAFNQRRKTLRNSLKPMIKAIDFNIEEHAELFQKRPEQLGVNQFVRLTQLLTT